MDTRFKPRTGTPLRQRVLDFVREKGSVNYDDLRLKFPDQKKSPVYAALRKLVADGSLVRKEGLEFDTWQTAEFNEIEVHNVMELSIKLMEELDRSRNAINGYLGDPNGVSRGFTQNMFLPVLNALVSQHMPGRKIKAEQGLERAIRSSEVYLGLAKLLLAAVRSGFVVPPNWQNSLPEIADFLDEWDHIEIEIPDALLRHRSGPTWDEDDNLISELEQDGREI